VPYKHLPLSSLLTNQNNDRHGELPDETAAIAWLLANREEHMKNLTRDIVKEKGIYEPPLVSLVGNKYTVFDGNRRVTCLKLLADPKRATTTEFQNFYRQEREKWEGDFPNEIECQVETEKDKIDEILYRRHTGSQSGVGQSQWDDVAKTNFVHRTGKKTKVNVAEEIESLLRQKGLMTAKKKLPRANMNRLLSSEPIRNRVGFTIRGGKLLFTHTEDKALSAMSRITEDLIDKKITLDDIWDNARKSKYLDKLEEAQLLPTKNDLLPSGLAAGKKGAPTKQPATKKAARTHRVTLIPSDLDYGVNWTGDTSRLRDIWQELQHELTLDRHKNAVAVLFRVLIELSVEHYIAVRKPANVHVNDKLAQKVVKAAAYMNTNGSLEDKRFQEIRKFDKHEIIISASTMNNYVHSPTFSPSPHHLTAVWDTLAEFIVISLNAA